MGNVEPVQSSVYYDTRHISLTKWNRRHMYRREIPDTGIVMLMLVSTLSWIPPHPFQWTAHLKWMALQNHTNTNLQYCVFEQYYATQSAVPFKHILYHSVSWCTSKYHGITTERMLSKGHGLKSNTVVTVIGNLVFSIKVFAGSNRTGKDWNLQSVCQDDI